MIKHMLDAEKFVLELDGYEAELCYQKRDQILVFDHTFVPDQLRGRGAAKDLVEYGIKFAREHQFKIQPKCSFVVAYFEKHKKEVEDILSQ